MKIKNIKIYLSILAITVAIATSGILGGYINKRVSKGADYQLLKDQVKRNTNQIKENTGKITSFDLRLVLIDYKLNEILCILDPKRCK